MPVKNFPVLYHKGKAGVIYSWEVSAEGDTITSTAGTLNGLKTVTSKKVEQKNIGKANETSLEDQAIKEAQAMWTYKLERKYSETVEDAQEELFLPMLAQEFDKKKKKLTYPAYIQPKLDGCRALAHWDGDKVILTSRNGKEWLFVPHINAELEKYLPKNCVLDGELYIDGKSFQEITRLIKKTRPETVQVQYHIYDYPTWYGNPFLGNKLRLEELSELFRPIPLDSPLQKVQTLTVFKEEDVIEYHNLFVSEGYEGAIVRAENGLYLYGYRSNDLLKVKKFDDAEFEIVGHKTGKGRYVGAVCWRCITPEGMEFDVNPKATIEEKKDLLKNAKNHYGKMLKVRYFGKSEDQVPRFPVGLGIRLEEDM
jgi:ATP-dependent DNA ligase